jgi:hypothetical protein
MDMPPFAALECRLLDVRRRSGALDVQISCGASEDHPMPAPSQPSNFANRSYAALLRIVSGLINSNED